MAKNTDQVLGHAAEADGIEEYDNPLPDWWLGLFWFTIFWAIGYTVWYHVVDDRSFESRLAAEVAAAHERWPTQGTGGAAAVAASIDFSENTLEDGEEVYEAYCQNCHGENLGGGIGVNLTDAEWIHGGTPSDVIRTITEGVPEKGMLTWGPILSEDQIRNVASYVLSRNAAALGLSLDSIAASVGGDMDDDDADEGEGE